MIAYPRKNASRLARPKSYMPCDVALNSASNDVRFIKQLPVLIALLEENETCQKKFGFPKKK